VGAVAAQLHDLFGEDVTVHAVDLHLDARGTLGVVDLDGLPFTVRRVFVVNGVPAGTVRGGHGHSRGVQGLFCIRGRIDVELRRGEAALEVPLRPDGAGLLVRAGVWSQQRYVLGGSELLVLASEPYDPSTYDPAPRG
jgi:hypothetical protein